MEKKYSITITKLPESLIEIKGTITWDAFARYEQEAFQRLALHLELPGFRKGQIPETMARKHIGDELLLPDMAELALNEYYPKIVEEIAQKEQVDPIGRPSIALTKLVRGNELGFTITTAIIPEIALPNYKKIAAGIAAPEEVMVSDEDVDKVINELQQLRAYGHVHAPTDTHEHGEPLPEVTDEFAKSFGKFNTVAELRAKIKENLLQEKERDGLDKRRLQILDALLAETKFAVPAILIQSEQEKMLGQIEAEITRAGMTLDDYLEKTNKTKEAILEEYKPEAERRARMQLVLNAISKDADLSPTPEEVEEEANRLIAQYPGADLERTKAYADMLLTNEKVLKMLEEQK